MSDTAAPTAVPSHAGGHPPANGQIYGLMAEFLEPHHVVVAAKRAYRAGYRKMDGYTPMPVDGLAEAIGFKKNNVPLIVLIGGLTGALSGMAMQWFSATIHYPLIVGGRPFASWPSFVPVTFELGILLASFSAVVGMLALNGLPLPYHPVFNAPGFDLASQDRFFLCVEATDPKFDLTQTRQFLESVGARNVTVVEH
jgi:hypothetical protein